MSRVISVEKQSGAHGGRYVARVEGLPGEAELVFSNRGAGVISADHTGAPAPLRGTGAAPALVERMIADARAFGFRIAPTCPYVLAQYRRHPDWEDAMATPWPGVQSL